MKPTMLTAITTALYLTCTAISLGALAGPAAAFQPEQDPPTKTVRFDDLNIANPAGAKVLYKRIEAAAQAVCVSPGRTDLHQVPIQRACIDRAIENAVKNVNSPALTQIHLGRQIRLAAK